MKRKEIKKQAWEMIKGNKWHILKPLVLFYVLIMALYLLIVLVLSLVSNNDAMNLYITGVNITMYITWILVIIFNISYAQYILDFVRKNDSSFILAISKVKDKVLKFFVVSLLIGLMIVGGTIALVVTGIIIAIGHIFYQYVFIDNKDQSMGEIIKKSWNVTNGRKMDLFVLGLSFIGWYIVGTLTLGILYIWVIPYVTITFALAYNELKK